MAIDGFTAPGYEGVRDAFEKNFADGRDIGAAFAAYADGELVVDLWGGVADPATGAPWARDTIIGVFSTTKGVTAICANRLIDEGRLDPDAPVPQYWPEFAQAGKDRVPVHQLLSHRAGLPWVDEKLSLDQVLAWEPIVDALARQTPIWEPGTQHGYHAVTFGNLAGELVRRVTGRSVGTYFREEIAAPLGLDFWIGLPEDLEARVAPLIGGVDADGGGLDEASRAALAEFIGPESVLGKALTVNGALGGSDTFNSRAVHAAEVPGAGGIGDARSIARLYAACIGEVDGRRVLSPDAVTRASTRHTEGPDVVILNLDLQFGLGFFVPSSLLQLGGPRSFGHFGLGGSAGWCDPEAGLAFGYVMNRMELGIAGDLRSYSLVNACYDAQE